MAAAAPPPGVGCFEARAVTNCSMGMVFVGAIVFINVLLVLELVGGRRLVAGAECAIIQERVIRIDDR